MRQNIFAAQEFRWFQVIFKIHQQMVYSQMWQFYVSSLNRHYFKEHTKAQAVLHSETNLVGVYSCGPLIINLQATVHYFFVLSQQSPCPALLLLLSWSSSCPNTCFLSPCDFHLEKRGRGFSLRRKQRVFEVCLLCRCDVVTYVSSLLVYDVPTHICIWLLKLIDYSLVLFFRE